MLLVLTMLATLFVGVGTASAAAEYVTISGSFTYVSADEDQTPGTIRVVAGEDESECPSFDTIYAKVTLPDGVSFSAIDDDSFTTQASWSANLSGTLTALNTAIATEMANAGLLDIDSDFTGNVSAEVEVWAVDNDEIIFETIDNIIIAKVTSGDVTVTAKSAKSVSVGTNKLAATISIKEDSPGALTSGNTISFVIKNNKVKWDRTNTAVSDNPAALVGGPAYPSDSTMRLTIGTNTSAVKGSITVTPRLVVQPGATGDVVIKVSGSDIETTELTVATIGESSITIDVDKDDKDTIRLGRTATLDDVEITLEPSQALNEGDYFTMTLPEGLKWASEDDWNYEGYMDGDDPDLSVDDQDTVVTFGTGNDPYVSGLFNDNRSLWISLGPDADDGDIVISDLKIVADANAEVGDLNVTFDGCASGTYKIGKVDVPFTVTADPITAPLKGNNVAGNKITITEAAAGAIIATTGGAGSDNNTGVVEYLDIILPMGVTFADTPTVKVTEGDLDLGTATLSDDESVLRIDIDAASNVASTIEITNITYDIDNRASEGEFIAKVGKEYNLVSSTALASVKLGTIGNAVGESVFTFGSTTYTLNGVEKTMDVAPYAKNNRTYMPIRYVAYALGINDANIFWDQASQSVTLMKGDKVVQLKVGSNVMIVNGAPITMDVAVEASNGRTFLPAAWVCQAFGATATWDAETNTVTIK